MTKWNCCKKDPPETGRKVLCHRHGDIYVAMRVKQYYLPVPFCDHYFSEDLCLPDNWCEIDYPDGLTGHLRVCMSGSDKIITLSEMEVDFPKEFHDFASSLIASIGTLKGPAQHNP